jgi:hypothetical protein
MKIESIGKYKVGLTGFWEGLFKELRTNCIGSPFQTYPYNPHSVRGRDELSYSAKKT